MSSLPLAAKNDHCFGVPNLYKEHQIYIAELTTIILYFYR